MKKWYFKVIIFPGLFISFFIWIVNSLRMESSMLNEKIQAEVNYRFKAKVVNYNYLNSYSSGVMKLKLIEGTFNFLHRDQKDIISGVLNSKDSTMYYFVSFYPDLLPPMEKDIKPIELFVNSKSMKAIIVYSDSTTIIESKLTFYPKSSFNKKGFFKAISKIESQHLLYW